MLEETENKTKMTNRRISWWDVKCYREERIEKKKREKEGERDEGVGRGEIARTTKLPTHSPMRLLTYGVWGFAGAASRSAVCGSQPSRGSSVSPSPSLPLFVSLSSTLSSPSSSSSPLVAYIAYCSNTWHRDVKAKCWKYVLAFAKPRR